MKSDAIKKGIERAPHRALLKSLGIVENDLKKPFIAIVNSYTSIVPGHVHLNHVANAVANGIRRGGGVPFEFNTIAVCDGLAMGHEGMKYSLPSRDIIADSIEIMIQAHRFDGMVLIPNCDKVTPGMLMAAARIDIPSIVITGGPMLSGRYKGRKLGVISMFEAVGEFKANKITKKDLKEFEDRACPTPGSCNGMFTANTMACVTEALGLSLPYSAAIPAVDVRRQRIAEKSGEKILDLINKDLKPSDVLNIDSFQNAIIVDMALGGSTNTVLHLSAIAREARIPLSLEIFDTISKKTPHLCDMSPSGPYTMDDLDKAGGIPAVMKELEPFLNSESITVSTFTISKNIEEAKTFDKEVIRPLSNPVHQEGGISILWGNIAPKGAVVKTGAVPPELLTHKGPARVFNSEEDAMNAILNGNIKKRDVVLIRFEGPKGGPGMREMLSPSSAIVGLGLSESIALITDGRFSGGSRGLCVGHISPEAAENGPIAIIEEEDIIEIDIPHRTINVQICEKELLSRLQKLEPFKFKIQKGYLTRYSNMVKSANEGATLRIPYTK
ncbi:MAG: dihydroxy-acid dehydratase [Candidatus Bathyarchaeota archaeon]|nr:MAG: dihydroxy-acid dehydratase [Candidatus Bathyarchaeota archaeon]